MSKYINLNFTLDKNSVMTKNDLDLDEYAFILEYLTNITIHLDIDHENCTYKIDKVATRYDLPDT